VSSVNALVRRCLDKKQAELEWPYEGGIAVAVVDRGVLHEGVSGLRDRERQLPITRETLFDTGSITKGFTAAAFVKTQSEGPLRLDAPLARSIAAFELRDEDASQRVSLADLLTHRSGLPAHDFLWLFSGASAAELTSRLRFLDPIPGAFARSFAYNNLGYAAAGVVYQRLAGNTIEQAIVTKLLNPLCMHSSSFEPSKAAASDVACPYSGAMPIRRRDAWSIAAAAGLRSNISDLGKWLLMYLNHGIAPSGARVLSETSIQTIFQERVSIENAGPILLLGLEWVERPAYGLGWMSGYVKGHRLLFHTGFIDGFSCVIGLVPAKDFGIVVLTNVNLSAMPGELLRAAIEERLDTPIATQPVLPRFPGAIAGPGLAHEPESLAGDYADAAYGILTVHETAAGASLCYGTHKWPLTLTGRDEGVFAVEAFGLRIGMPISFHLRGDRAAQVTLPLALDPRVPPQRFTRV
jgi:CubicO group peptidase (beta-lactamase class C family)